MGTISELNAEARRPMPPGKPYLTKRHYLVFCSECGRVSVYASHQTADPQRNWHELQHLEGVVGKQTVVGVHVIPE